MFILRVKSRVSIFVARKNSPVPLRKLELTVFVVVAPHLHELIRRKFFQFAGMGVAILPHEVCCLFQVEAFTVNLIRLGCHLRDKPGTREKLRALQDLWAELMQNRTKKEDFPATESPTGIAPVSRFRLPVRDLFVVCLRFYVNWALVYVTDFNWVPI